MFFSPVPRAVAQEQQEEEELQGVGEPIDLDDPGTAATEAPAKKTKAEERKERAAKKAAEREERRKAKEAAKAAREAEKAAKKAAREAEKAEKKAAREAEKAAKKAAKEAEQAAKKAAKEAAQQEREAGSADQAGADPAGDGGMASDSGPGAAGRQGDEPVKVVPKKVSRADRQKAKKLVKEGTKQVNAKQYDAAIQSFTAAYELDPKPELLVNLGIAYHLQGDARADADDMHGGLDDRQRALAYYQKYLATGARGALTEQTKQYIDDLQHRIKVAGELIAAQEAHQNAKAELARARETAQKAQQEREEAVRRAEREQAKIREQVEAAEEERDQWKEIATSRGSGAGAGKRAIGSSILVLGGAALGAAAFYGLDARSANQELGSLGEGDVWDASREWLHKRGEASERNMLIYSIAGAALVATGATVYYLGERDAKKPRGESFEVAIAPGVGAHSAGVQVSGRF